VDHIEDAYEVVYPLPTELPAKSWLGWLEEVIAGSTAIIRRKWKKTESRFATQWRAEIASGRGAVMFLVECHLLWGYQQLWLESVIASMSQSRQSQQTLWSLRTI